MEAITDRHANGALFELIDCAAGSAYVLVRFTLGITSAVVTKAQAYTCQT